MPQTKIDKRSLNAAAPAIAGEVVTCFDPATNADALYRVCIGHVEIQGVSGWISWAEHGRRGAKQARRAITTEPASLARAVSMANERVRAKTTKGRYTGDGTICPSDAASRAELEALFAASSV